MKSKLNAYNKAISQSKNILIITSRPLDNDCIASGIILKKLLENKRKNVKLVFSRKISKKETENNSYLPFFKEIIPIDSREAIRQDIYDTAILLDGSNLIQFYDFKKSLEPKLNLESFKNVIYIDHHPKLSGEIHASTVIWDPKASSTIEVIFTYLYDPNMIKNKLATLAYAALVGDTGNFKWNFNSKTLELGSIFAKNNADVGLILQKYFRNNKKDDLKLIKLIVENLKHNKNLNIQWLILDLKKVTKLNLNKEMIKDIERIFSHQIATLYKDYKIGICLIQENKNSTRVVAKGDEVKNKVDLANLLKKAGTNGGGHTQFVMANINNKTPIQIKKFIEKTLYER